MTKEFDARNERKSRSVCAAMAEAADTGKRTLTEREREILDMWPKFEDGEPVMIGDEATNNKNQRFTVKLIEFRHGKWMLNDSVTDGHYLNGKSGKRVERPAPKVLDADGVEIEVGDTVYVPWMYGDTGFTVSRFAKICDGDTIVMVKEMGSGLFPKTVTHTRPAYETRESVVYEIGEDMAKRIDAIVSAGRWK